MATVESPRGDLYFTMVTLRKGGRVILQDYNSISPMLPVEMIPEPVPSTGGPRAAREGAGALCCAFWETDVVYLG